MNLSKKKKSDLIFWGIFAVVVAFLYLTPWGSSTRTWVGGLFLSSPSIESNEKPILLSTDWNLRNLDEDEIWLSDTDKPVFINIWATWCGPCRSEMPSINDLYNKYKNKAEFILVSPDETLGKLKDFATNNDYNLPFYNAISYTPKELFTNSYPTTFILDKNKNIVFKSTGAHDWNSDNVHVLLDKLIAQ